MLLRSSGASSQAAGAAFRAALLRRTSGQQVARSMAKVIRGRAPVCPCAVTPHARARTAATRPRALTSLTASCAHTTAKMTSCSRIAGLQILHAERLVRLREELPLVAPQCQAEAKPARQDLATAAARAGGHHQSVREAAAAGALRRARGLQCRPPAAYRRPELRRCWVTRGPAVVPLAQVAGSLLAQQRGSLALPTRPPVSSPRDCNELFVTNSDDGADALKAAALTCCGRSTHANRLPGPRLHVAISRLLFTSSSGSIGCCEHVRCCRQTCDPDSEVIASACSGFARLLPMAACPIALLNTRLSDAAEATLRILVAGGWLLNMVPLP